MKYHATALTLWCVLPVFTFAQSLRYPVAMPYINLTAQSLQHQDVFSFAANPAALARQKTAAIGVYAEQRFSLKATANYRLAAAFPSRLGNLGLLVQYGGFKNYNQSVAGLAYGRSLGTKAEVGIQFNYYASRTPGYSSTGNIGAEAGIRLHFTDKLHAGIQVSNPFPAPTVKGNEERSAAVYKLGIGYDVSELFFIGTEMVKEEDLPVNLITGMQYRFMKQLFARAGFTSATALLFAGAGLAWSHYRADISVSFHPQLGLSPGFLLVMDIAGNK